MKAYRAPIIIIVLLVITQLLFEHYRPKSLDWKPNYEYKEKKPLGCYLSYQMLSHLFEAHSIKVVQQPIYNQLGGEDNDLTASMYEQAIDTDTTNYEAEANNYDNDTTTSIGESYEDETAPQTNGETDHTATNDLDENNGEATDTIIYDISNQDHSSEQYLFVTQNLEADALDTRLLLNFVETGGTVFIAAEALSDTLARTIGISTSGHFTWNDTSQYAITLTHPRYASKQQYHFDQRHTDHYFDQLDTANTTILGYIEAERPNFIALRRGKGVFYLHSNPTLFANYTAIQDSGAQYIAQVFAHLPNPHTTYWDEQYKPNRAIYRDSPLRYILSVDALRWAWYLSLAGVVLFMLIESKRRQRPIPIVEPLRNTTLDFARTIGLLYYQQGDHRDLANKKITHFGDFLRQRLYLPPLQLERDYYQLVAQKSEQPLADIEAIFRLIVQVRTQASIEPETLLDLNRRIDNFYRNIG